MDLTEFFANLRQISEHTAKINTSNGCVQYDGLNPVCWYVKEVFPGEEWATVIDCLRILGIRKQYWTQLRAMPVDFYNENMPREFSHDPV